MPQAPASLSEEHQSALLQIARDSIRHGFARQRALIVDLSLCPEALQVPAPVFVTLMIGKELRGCIGTLEANRPLAANTAYYAHAAAFADARFSPLEPDEFSNLEIKISILSPLEPLTFTDERDLISQIQPGVDGLLLEDDGYRGTFLPSVWESLPEPAEFVRRLKVKAGLYPDYWSDTIRISRYTVFYLEGQAEPSPEAPPADELQ